MAEAKYTIRVNIIYFGYMMGPCAMMAVSMGFPAWAAIYVAWDTVHRIFFILTAAPSLCFSMGLFFLMPSRKEIARPSRFGKPAARKSFWLRLFARRKAPTP